MLKSSESGEPVTMSELEYEALGALENESYKRFTDAVEAERAAYRRYITDRRKYFRWGDAHLEAAREHQAAAITIRVDQGSLEALNEVQRWYEAVDECCAKADKASRALDQSREVWEETRRRRSECYEEFMKVWEVRGRVESAHRM